MGASGWDYFVPFQDDVDGALQALRDRVFADGDYYADEPPDEVESADEVRARITDAIGDGIDDESLDALVSGIVAKQSRSAPTTITELLEAQAEDGTHSILDMACGVSQTAQFGTVSPLTDDELTQTFGTTLPRRPQVESWAESGEVDRYRGRWEGCYVVVAGDDGTPAEIAFVGFSGD